MIRVILNGALGRMGREVETLINASGGFEIAAKADAFADGDGVLSDLSAFDGQADVIIDFSHHLAAEPLLAYAVRRNIPAVIATTGHTEEEENKIREAAKTIPVFHSANMSLGVALLAELAGKAAAVMDNADIEIVETHHNRKLDAPSGTALMLANVLKKIRERAVLRFGRSGKDGRAKNEIGIHSVRMGNIVGIHEVLISTDTETITLKHEAHSRALFAEGALSAASFLCGKAPGLYDMNSIVKKEENV